MRVKSGTYSNRLGVRVQIRSELTVAEFKALFASKDEVVMAKFHPEKSDSQWVFATVSALMLAGYLR